MVTILFLMMILQIVGWCWMGGKPMANTCLPSGHLKGYVFPTGALWAGIGGALSWLGNVIRYSQGRYYLWRRGKEVVDA